MRLLVAHNLIRLADEATDGASTESLLLGLLTSRDCSARSVNTAIASGAGNDSALGGVRLERDAFELRKLLHSLIITAMITEFTQIDLIVV